MYYADLHLHSHYARATSRDCDLPHLDWWARKKGLALLGAGDFTHPAWRRELAEQLIPAGEGVYRLGESFRLPWNARWSPADPRFLISGEISCIYKQGGKTRKIHLVILLPSLEAAERLSRRLEQAGNLHSDGRPILGLSARDLLAVTLECCPQAVIIPAHIWTPHFSLLGAFSGFDSVEECFGDLSPWVRAVETGLSSDPSMNRRVTDLDRMLLVSHSDAHSPQKLGREADLLETGLSYGEVKTALETGKGFLGTVEYFPQEGKYHWDGHRNCGVCLSPLEAESLGNRCPVCGKPLTLGVAHRVEQLASRAPAGEPSWEYLVPLSQVLAACLGRGEQTKTVQSLYHRLVDTLGPEFCLLREASLESLASLGGETLARGIGCIRAGRVVWRPGYDGVYGSLSFAE